MTRRLGRISVLVVAGVLMAAGLPGVQASGIVALGSISGRVTAAAGGGGLDLVDMRVLDGSGNFVADGQSAADGSYTVSGLAATTTGYLVCALGHYRVGDGSPAGYAAQCYKNVAWDEVGRPRGATLVPVAAGVTVTGINFAQTKLGGISGRVTDAVTGAGVSGILILADDGGAHRDNETTTGSDGRYALLGLQPSATGYTVCFIGAFRRIGLVRGSAANNPDQHHDNKCYKNVPYHVDNLYPPRTTPVTVAAGVVTTGIDAVLELQGGISGRVTTTAGVGIPGLPVTVFDSAGLQPETLPLDNTTGPDGRYRVDGLDPSTGYTVCFDGGARYPSRCYKNVAWDGTQVAPGSTRVTVTAGATTTGIDSVWPAPGGISGRVTDAAGHGLSGVEVVASEVNGPTQIAFTSVTGRYLVSGLAASTGATVCFFPLSDANAGGKVPKTGYASECYRDVPYPGGGGSPPKTTPVPVAAGAVTPGINAALGLDGAISGSVTSAAGHHPLNVQVTAYNSAGRWAGSTQASNGRYFLAGMPASQAGYRVCFSTISYLTPGGSSTTGYIPQCYRNSPYAPWDDGTPGAGSVPVPVRAGSTSGGINVALHTGGAISGTVTAADGGAKLYNVGVYLFDSSGAKIQVTGTDEFGRYAISGLAVTATGYTVCFDSGVDSGNPSPTGYQTKCYKNTPWNGGTAPSPRATRLPVTFGQTVTGIDMALPDGATISGTVTAAATGVPVSRVEVVAFDGTHRVASTQTENDGTYRVSGLAASKSGYTVCFDSSTAAVHYAGQCYRNTAWRPTCPPPPGTRPVPVIADTATTGINATLRK